MPILLDNPHGYSLISAVAVGTGSAIDNRNGVNFGMFLSFTTGGSAIIDLMASPDGQTYMTAQSVTATNGITASGTWALYYPWIRADVRGRFAGSTASFFLAPGYGR